MVCVLWMGSEGPTLPLFFLPNTNVLILRDPRCCLLGGREDGRKEQGSLCLGTAALGSPQLRGIAAHPQMEDRALGVLAVCCFAPPNYLQAVLRCRYPPNGTESRAPPPCYPRRWVQMTPLLTCA